MYCEEIHVSYVGGGGLLYWEKDNNYVESAGTAEGEGLVGL